MKDQPLISVIVPIYRVEEYLDECIRSILEQTYRNLEIILIDDGSPDRCGEMCDRYHAQDTRIRVIHQKNRGLSAARNAGLNIATGEYVCFIDSDDYISPLYCERMLQAFSEYPQAKVIACSVLQDTDGDITELNPLRTRDTAILHSCEDWNEKAILGKINVTVWNKLYRAELLEDIRFREGRIVEDVFFAYDFSHIVQAHHANLVVLPDFLYYYRIRQGSICHNETPVLPESIRCRTEIAQECRESNPELARKLLQMVKQEVITFNRQLDMHEAWETQYASTFRPMMKEIRLTDIWGFDLSVRGRIALVIQRYLPILYPLAKHMWETFKRVRTKICRFR